jgi:RNA-directed DNA polymerase
MINNEKHLAYILRSSKEELNEVISNISAYYYHAKKAKTKYGDFQRDETGEIKKRNLTPSIFQLKYVQKKLNRFLQQIQMPVYAFGSVKGKSNILNALQHIENTYFLSVDLRDFFTRITNKQVFNMFLENRFSTTTSRILTQLTTYQGHLPQGAPTSPIIANLVFKKTGESLLKLAKLYEITFTSYLDDLTFSSKNDFKHIVPEILDIVKNDHFHINYKKISYKKYMPEVTGLIIYNKALQIVESMRLKGIINPSYNKHLNNYLESIKKCLTEHKASSL